MARTNAGNFVQGKAGERYVQTHINYLLAHGIVTQGADTAGDWIEGGDNKIVYCRFGKEVNVPEYVQKVVTLQSVGNEISETLVGGLEVKTICNFTFRTNDNNESTGTLPFELWNEDRYGWLLALLNPELRLDDDEIHAVQPVLLCYLLVSYLGPYACVMFEDFPALKQRLEDLAAEKGFQLAPLSEEQPQGIPTPAEADTWRLDDPYIIGNCWHIPFDRLSDLATVTLIGNMPKVKLPTGINDDDSYIELQQSRYAFLSECANGRLIPEEPEYRTEFYPADITHLYADVLNNMEIIENLNPEEYPHLCQALHSSGLKPHFEMLLYNMYSQPLISTINGYQMWFFQAKDYLYKWSKKYNVKGSRFSWQSHVIFLTDADLLKKYVKPGPKVFRSVPKYTEEVLRIADNKAKDYLDAGINLSDFTKRQVIKVSGQDRADFLYYGDGRKVSEIQKEVENEFVKTARQMLAEREIVLPSDVSSIVSDTLSHKYWYDFSDPDADRTIVRKHEQANRQVTRLSKRYEELSKDIPCQFRTLKKEEKVALGLSPRTRKKYYIK